MVFKRGEPGRAAWKVCWEEQRNLVGSPQSLQFSISVDHVLESFVLVCGFHHFFLGMLREVLFFLLIRLLTFDK